MTTETKKRQRSCQFRPGPPAQKAGNGAHYESPCRTGPALRQLGSGPQSTTGLNTRADPTAISSCLKKAEHKKPALAT